MYSVPVTDGKNIPMRRRKLDVISAVSCGDTPISPGLDSPTDKYCIGVFSVGMCEQVGKECVCIVYMVSNLKGCVCVHMSCTYSHTYS